MFEEGLFLNLQDLCVITNQDELSACLMKHFVKVLNQNEKEDENRRLILDRYLVNGIYIRGNAKQSNAIILSD